MAIFRLYHQISSLHIHRRYASIPSPIEHQMVQDLTQTNILARQGNLFNL